MQKELYAVWGQRGLKMRILFYTYDRNDSRGLVLPQGQDPE